MEARRLDLRTPAGDFVFGALRARDFVFEALRAGDLPFGDFVFGALRAGDLPFGDFVFGALRMGAFFTEPFLVAERFGDGERVLLAGIL